MIMKTLSLESFLVFHTREEVITLQLELFRFITTPQVVLTLLLDGQRSILIQPELKTQQTEP